MRIVIKTWKEISPRGIILAEELGYDSHIDYKNKLVVLKSEV